MKKLILLAALSLGACSTVPGVPGAAPKTADQQAQATWYVYCASYQAAQPAILAKIPTTAPSTLKAVQPIIDRVAAECQAPMPANSTVAVQTLTQDVTTVILQLGIDQASQGAVK